MKMEFRWLKDIRRDRYEFDQESTKLDTWFDDREFLVSTWQDTTITTIMKLAPDDVSRLCWGFLTHPVQGCGTCSWGHTLVCTADRDVTGYDIVGQPVGKSNPKMNHRAEEESNMAIETWGMMDWSIQLIEVHLIDLLWRIDKFDSIFLPCSFQNDEKLQELEHMKLWSTFSQLNFHCGSCDRPTHFAAHWLIQHIKEWLNHVEKHFLTRRRRSRTRLWHFKCVSIANARVSCLDHSSLISEWFISSQCLALVLVRHTS